MPEISVIVPVYKAEPWLRQCLDSVLAQTYTDYELILVDDGSPDNCGSICDAYAAQNSRIRVFHQENAGQGKARNVGMNLAVGKYLIFLDSDDYWLPETLETLYAEAERNKTQVLLFGAVPFWDGMKEPKTHPSYQRTTQNGAVKSGPESLKIAQDAGEYYVSPCLRFYLLEYLRGTGLQFDEGIIHEDITLSFFAVLLADRVECIGVQLYQRRYRPGSTMTGKSIKNSAHGYRVALDGLLDAYENRLLSALGREQLATHIITMSVIVRDLFRQALVQDWREASWIQQDVRKTLKRVRAVPGIPLSFRIATYSLFMNCLVQEGKTKLKRLAPATRKK